MYTENESTLVRAHFACPKCSSHDACAEYTDHYHCFSCGSTWYKNEATVTTTERNEQRMIEMIEEGKIREIADRCLTAETCNKFQVRSLVKEHRIQKHFYPYFSRTGEKVAEKVRIVDTKEFYWWGNQRDVALFGAQCQPTTGRFVVVGEGEIDAMTMWQVLGGRSTVVSVPGGCKSFKALKDNYEYLDKFDNIVLCFDGDKAGREAVEKAVMFLPQKKLKLMKLPEELKDPNEFLKAGKVQELTNYFWRAEQYTPKDIVAVSSMYDRLKDFRKTHQYIATPWAGLNDMIQGTRPGQLVVLTAGSGQGKSLYMKTWMMHIVRTTGFRVGGIFLEESPEETVISLMSQVAGKNLKRNDVYDSCTQEELKDYFDQVGADSKIDLFEPASNTEPDYILNKIRYLALARDCKYIILDHATFVAESGEDDIKVMSRLMKNLHELVVELDIVIIAACHTRKTATGQRSAEDGGRISADDMKGSSGIKQYSDIVIALERNSQAEDPIEANTTTIRVLKSRDLGMKGPATRVMYEKDTTRLVGLGLEEVQEEAMELKEDC